MPRKVFLLRFSSLGDVVLTSSLIGPLVEGGFSPVLITHPPYGSLFEEDRRLKVVEIPKEHLRGLRGIVSTAVELSKLSPYGVIDLHANPKSLILSRLIPAKVKIRYRKHSLRRRICVFLNRLGFAQKLKEKPLDVLKLYSETLKVLGVEIKNPRPRIELDKKRTPRVLETFGLTPGGYIVLGIGARYRSKAYPHFRELASFLTQRGFRVVLVGDKKDYKTSKGWRGVVNLCGKLSLNESLHIMRGAKLFVGNDSGATHMARAVGTKVLVIYGGTHPCLGFAPYPDEGKVFFKNLPCSPCHIHGTNSCPRHFECLDIPPHAVGNEILKMVSE